MAIKILAVGLLLAPTLGWASDVPSRTAVAPLLWHRFDAPRNTSHFGASVGAGDFNGDGTPDLVVGGSPTFIYSGSDLSLLLEIPGGAADFGLELEVPGDVDGDGGPDLLIATASEATVHSGVSGIALPFHSSVYGAGLDHGTSMSAMGDDDGDGRADYVIAELNFGNGEPRTTVYSGLDGAVLLGVAAGHSVAGLGDVNGDGTPDFATGRYGAIHVVSGALDAEGETLFTVPGYDASLGAADVNGDGIKDLLLMMPQATVNGAIGYVRAFSGADGDTLGSVEVPAHDCAGGCFFRGLVCGIGDVDGDGHEEFAASVVGSYGGNLRAGTVCVYSGATLSRIVQLTGPSPGAGFGYSLVGPGDVDGDGAPDLLVGAPGLTAPGRGPGAALLYRLVHDVASADAVSTRAPLIQPNPARRGATVTLSFAELGAGQREVMIIDVTGRLVRQLAAPPGGRLVWDGLDDRAHPVSPGVYFVRSAGTRESAKLVIVD